KPGKEPFEDRRRLSLPRGRLEGQLQIGSGDDRTIGLTPLLEVAEEDQPPEGVAEEEEALRSAPGFLHQAVEVEKVVFEAIDVPTRPLREAMAPKVEEEAIETAVSERLHQLQVAAGVLAVAVDDRDRGPRPRNPMRLPVDP